jgi:hypothetical protein
MADNKNVKKEEKKTTITGQEKIPELLAKANEVFAKEMVGRPYLLVVASGFEIGNEGNRSRIAAQWAWRSNVIVGSEDGPAVADFFCNQLREVADDQKHGVKAKYKKK